VRITVVGAGYVGLVTAACLADLGHDVWCIDVDPGRIAALETGTLPIFEPGLGEIVERTVLAGRLLFSTNHAEAVPDSDVVFIAVGTPAGDDGSVDLTQVRSAIEQMAPHLAPDATVIMKSTVPVGTTRESGVWLEELRPGLAVAVGANPEFLRQPRGRGGSERGICPPRRRRGSDDPHRSGDGRTHQVRLQLPTGDQALLHQRDRRPL
jgi:UDPglucose 6-dehydrogenase